MGYQTQKDSQILVLWLQIVYNSCEVTRKNRYGNETVIEKFTVLCEKYTVSSYMHLQFMPTSSLRVVLQKIR